MTAADVVWTRVFWHNELRMTREELKEEHKQSDGDPIVKARLRSLSRDRARRRMLQAVPRATLVITNPTHYAVALRYVREEGGAQLVVAKGKDLIALRIREVAAESGIPIVENKPLARNSVGAGLYRGPKRPARHGRRRGRRFHLRPAAGAARTAGAGQPRTHAAAALYSAAASSAEVGEKC